MKPKNPFGVVASVGVLFLTSVAFTGHSARAQSTTTMTPRPALNEPLDYSKLFNPVYDYIDIVKAKTYRLSDEDVARVLKISRASGRSFSSVVAAVSRGETIASLAKNANLRPSDLTHLDKEKDELAAFEAAYFTTGWNAERRNNIDYLLAKAAQQAAMKDKPMK